MTAASGRAVVLVIYKEIAEIKECLFILRVAVNIAFKYWKN
jgi:hypothetical protein